MARFPGTKLNWEHVVQLRDAGFCVVEDVLDVSQCVQIRKDWLDTMGAYGTGFRADDSSTWTQKGTRPWNTRGIQEYPPVAHEHWVWEARLQAAPVFEALWQTPARDQISSFDRACFVPSGRYPRTSDWLHLDQASEKRRGTLQCVQGMLVLEDIGDSEVALEVLRGAHLHHEQLFAAPSLTEKRLNKCKSAEWLKLTEADIKWYSGQKNVERIRIKARKGSLILWDSRLPHHAVPPCTGAQGKDRFCIYVCMLPRRCATQARLKAHRKYFDEGRATSHWPQDAKVFQEKPQLYGQPLPEYIFDPRAQLHQRDTRVPDRDLMRRLAGF